jgi:ribosomal protein L31
MDTQFKFSSETTVLTDGSTVQTNTIGHADEFNFLEIDSIKHPVWHHLKDFRELKETGRLISYNTRYDINN